MRGIEEEELKQSEEVKESLREQAKSESSPKSNEN